MFSLQLRLQERLLHGTAYLHWPQRRANLKSIRCLGHAEAALLKHVLRRAMLFYVVLCAYHLPVAYARVFTRLRLVAQTLRHLFSYMGSPWGAPCGVYLSTLWPRVTTSSPLICVAVARHRDRPGRLRRRVHRVGV